MEIIKTESLYFKDGSSDKVYHAMLVKVDGGYLVNFEFGRRDTKLQTGTKTPLPVNETEANTIIAKLVKEKTAKGYRPE